jgi:hypothetical protein
MQSGVLSPESGDGRLQSLTFQWAAAGLVGGTAGVRAGSCGNLDRIYHPGSPAGRRPHGASSRRRRRCFLGVGGVSSVPKYPSFSFSEKQF